LRRQLDDLGKSTGQRYLLTAAIPAGRVLPEQCFDLRASSAILDWVNVMTYDMNGAGESGLTNFNAAFRPSSSDPRADDVRRDWSVVGSVEAFEDLGVPRDQLVVGVPFYGRGFTGVPDVNDGLYQPFSETISVDYRTVKSDYLNRPNFRHLRHAEAEVPWLYDPSSGTMLSYDDPVSIGRKTDFVREQGLGGVMLWELSEDDEDSSLLRAISERLEA
jgi:chitinase